jgi:hypothetical protein
VAGNRKVGQKHLLGRSGGWNAEARQVVKSAESSSDHLVLILMAIFIVRVD